MKTEFVKSGFLHLRILNVKYLFLIILFLPALTCTIMDDEEIGKPMDIIDTGLFTKGIEGPSFDKNGNLYVVNYQNQGTIGVIGPDSKTSLFIKLPEGSVGNAICFSSDGHMFIADYMDHNILKVSFPSKEIEIFAHNESMNQPNDICIRSDGFIFASDPNWADSTGKLWLIDSGGKTVCLDSLLGTTNGIELSPDEKQLYVNESIQRKIWVYDLSDKGAISNKRLFFEFLDFGLDGMGFDRNGNLYVTRYGKGTVAIFSNQGKIINEVRLKGKNPTNIAFGGKNNEYCYVTEAERQCIEKFRIE